MFRVVIAFALIACTAAFAPSAARGRSVSMMAAEKSKAVPFLPDPVNLKGLPGNKGFDPVGFSNFIDVRFLQEAEIKHCRVAMLAWLGFVATEFVQLPGEVHNVSPVAAHNAAVASGAGFQVLTFIAALEFISTVAVKEMLEGSGRKPGEFGFDPLGFSAKGSQADKDAMAAKELENGRTAMLAFAGVVTQAVITGKGFPYLN